MHLDIIMLQCQEGFFSEEKSMTNDFEIIYFSICLTSAKNATFYVGGLSSKLNTPNLFLEGLLKRHICQRIFNHLKQLPFVDVI